MGYSGALWGWWRVGAGMLLTGTYNRTLDDKLRLAVPKPIREILEKTGSKRLYLAPGTDGSLAIYSEEAFSKLAARLEQASPNRQDVRAYMRLFYSRAQSVEWDGQGRIRVAVELAPWVKAGAEVVLVGVHDHCEVWDGAAWNAYVNGLQTRYDEVAESAFDQ